MKKKVFALIMTVAVLGGTTGIYAQDKGSLYIDGKEIASTLAEDEAVLVPLRATAEALGYKVEWIAESKTVTLSKDGETITVAFTEKGYTLNSTPLTDGKVKISEGTTLAEVNTLANILNLSISINGADVDVITATEVKGEGTVKEITTDGGYSLVFEDSKTGEIILHIDEGNTKITDPEGNTLKKEDITEGSELEVVYGDAVMQSLPPQNVPKSIVVKEAPKAVEKLTITGSVIEKTEEYLVVESTDEKDSYDLVALVVSESTEGDGTKAEVGDKITAEFSPVMTRSIPPQTEAFSINLVK